MSRKRDRKTRSAVALSYDGGVAPNITAKGYGRVADRILEIAEAEGVPIKQDPALAAALSEIPLGDHIPEPLFQAVAEVLAYVYYLSDKSLPGIEDEPS